MGSADNTAGQGGGHPPYGFPGAHGRTISYRRQRQLDKALPGKPSHGYPDHEPVPVLPMATITVLPMATITAGFN